MALTLELAKLSELSGCDIALGPHGPTPPNDEGETDPQGEAVDESTAPEGNGGGTAGSRQNCVHGGILLKNGVHV